MPFVRSNRAQSKPRAPGNTKRQSAAARKIAVLYTTAPAELAAAPEKLREAEDLTGNARRVAQALGAHGHSVRCIGFGDDLGSLLAKLRSFSPDVVFNLAEGPLGCYEKEPHAVTLFELLGWPYTGNGPVPIILCKNKAVTKQLLQAHGVPTPRFCVCASVPRRAPSLNFPLVVKPLRQDGSIGITDASVVNNPGQLRRSVEQVLQTCRQEALVEEFVGGREFNVSVLGNGKPYTPFRMLPPGEYLYHSDRWRVCTFNAKWDEAHPSYAAVEAVCPAKLSGALRRQLERLAFACARIFEMTGYARLDFRLDHAGLAQVLDVNPNPDLAPRMGIARSAEAAGIPYSALLEEILRLGLERGAR